MTYRSALVVSGAVITAMLALSGWAWTTLPADAAIPVHWGLSGSPDRSRRLGAVALR